MIIHDILKGILIGICASAPLGPIAIFVIQKTIDKGFRTGFLTAMGSCIVDTIFAIIALFALGFAKEFIANREQLIFLVGGVVVALLGWSMAVKDPMKRVHKKETESDMPFVNLLQALAMGIANPGAVLVIFSLFAIFGIDPENYSKDNWTFLPLILSVSLGSMLWWFIVTFSLGHYRKKFNLRTVLWINRITGTIVIIIGIAFIGQWLFNILFRHASPFEALTL